MEPLIPGLPDDLARECLFRIHYTQLFTVCSVSKAWKSLLLSREFRLHREQHCYSNKLILFQGWIGKISQLILFEIDTNIWSELPPIPDFPNGLPTTFHFVTASFKWGFVIVGVNCSIDYTNIVYVFDYLSAMWRRRADVPSQTFYPQTCVSDRDRSVYILFSCHYSLEVCIMAYDVMKDEWGPRINTKEEVCRCMIYQGGKIHFYNGVSNFDKKVLNVSTWEWEPSQLDFIDKNVTSIKIALNEDGEWYSFRSGGTLAIYKDFTWEVIHKWQEFIYFCSIAMWKTKVLIIWEVSAQMEACIIDLKNREFTKIYAPTKLLSLIHAENCYLEI